MREMRRGRWPVVTHQRRLVGDPIGDKVYGLEKEEDGGEGSKGTRKKMERMEGKKMGEKNRGSTLGIGGRERV